MRVDDWLAATVHSLDSVGIPSSRLDALILLEDCLGQNRAHLLAHNDLMLDNSQIELLAAAIDRRMTHEPLAYIRGQTEFYGRDFYVDQRVLEPRPESETIIKLLLTLAPAPSLIVDVGTGSGALAITAQLELPAAEVIGIDNDPDCLAVAKYNSERLKAQVIFFAGDLVEPMFIQQRPSVNTVLLCNLPYVPDHLALNKAARHEPTQAIFGGSDGLAAYRRLFEQLTAHNFVVQQIVTEALPAQHSRLERIASVHHYKVVQSEDFIQVLRPV